MRTTKTKLQELTLIATRVAVAFLIPCVQGSSVVETSFGSTKEGQEVRQFELTSNSGVKAEILTYGAIVRSLKIPDSNGALTDVVLGFSSMEDYEQKSHHHGAAVGRYASRINNARFELDGAVYELPKNLGGVHAVHGGPRGFGFVVWDAIATSESDEPSVTLQYVSPDGEMGFPGELTTRITYSLTNENALRIDYYATTSKPTPINFTNHSYFNLKGEGQGDALDHLLQINASRALTAPGGVPTGEIESVANTVLDFRTLTPIGLNIKEPVLESRRGFNHYFIIDDSDDELAHTAVLIHPNSGRRMDVYTTEPGLQFYAGNFLNDQQIGKSGSPLQPHAGICLETEHYPDSPNQPHFPDTILRPGEIFQSTTLYQFSSEGRSG